MFKKTHVSVISFLIVASALVACSKKEARTGDNSLMIVEMSGQSIVVRGDKEMPATVGMLVGGEDVIRAVTGTLDAQNRAGALLRLRAGTSISVRQLTGGRDVDVNLKSGSLTGRLDKARAGENLSVTSPTAIAGVRGTTFLIEADASSSSVRVLEGLVAVAPVADKGASKNVAETVLSPGENGSVQPGKAVKVAAHPVTEKEILYKATVVPVPADVFDRVAGGASTSEISATLAKRRAAEMEKALASMGYGRAPALVLSSEKELRQFYPELDSVVLKNGQKLTGAVIASDDQGLVMHTVRGIVRIERLEIASSQIHSR